MVIDKLNIESISNSSTKILYQNRLNQKLEGSNTEEVCSVANMWEVLKSNFIQVEKELFETRMINKHKRFMRAQMNERVDAEQKKTAFLVQAKPIS